MHTYLTQVLFNLSLTIWPFFSRIPGRVGLKARYEAEEDVDFISEVAEGILFTSQGAEKQAMRD